MAHNEGTLRALLRKIADDNSYADRKIDVEPILSGGANYTSQLFLATISSPPKPDLKLFAKIGSFSEKIRAKVNADRLYKTEDLIYTKLVSVWDSLQEKYQVPADQRFVFPKFYGGSQKLGSETVVLEDLAAAGYGSSNRHHSLDWEHAASAVTVLARFHGLSFVLEKEDPVVYNSVVQQLQFEHLSDVDDGKELWEKMMGNAFEVVDEQSRGKMSKFFEKAGQFMYADYHSPRGRPILGHGDYRSSNLLFRRQNGKLETIVIDYQTVHTGCPVTDLVYLVFMSTDEQFRRQHYHQLVEHYYQQLSQALDLYQIDVDDVYPRSQFDDHLKEVLPYAVLLGVMILPVVTVEADSAPRTGDHDADIEDFAVKPNELYRNRFSGLVSDLVRWGAI